MVDIPITAEEINYHLVRIATADDGPFMPGRAKGWGTAPSKSRASYAKRRMAWDSKNCFAAWKRCGASSSMRRTHLNGAERRSLELIVNPPHN